MHPKMTAELLSKLNNTNLFWTTLFTFGQFRFSIFFSTNKKLNKHMVYISFSPLRMIPAFRVSVAFFSNPKFSTNSSYHLQAFLQSQRRNTLTQMMMMYLIDTLDSKLFHLWSLTSGVTAVYVRSARNTPSAVVKLLLKLSRDNL